MRLRDRDDVNDPLLREPYTPGDPEGANDDLREAGEAFLAAADEAIDRALSGNSAEFLAQNRQAGGQ